MLGKERTGSARRWHARRRAHTGGDVVRAALIALAIAGCGSPPPSESDAGLDAGPGRDAGPHAATCAEQCESCGIGPCGADGSGWCASQGECIATATTCDDARACIMGPHPLASLPVCDGGVVSWLALDRLAPIPRDTDAYRAPEPAVRDHVAAAIAAVARLDAPTIEAEAEAAAYVACRGEDAKSDLVLLRPDGASSGHATIVIRAVGTPRDVILEAPHPLWDANTVAESVAIFDRIGARAVVASGTHRCGSERASGCDGVADACGEDAPVRESDMAHAVDSVFQAAHVALANAYSDAWIVSVHGFTGPGVSVSNGTNDPVAVDTRVTRLAVALGARLDDVTTCNVSGAPGTDPFERLCGTTNVQGRHLNGVAMACTDAAIAASDRFAHLEQDRTIRDERGDDVADAIAEAFDAM